MRALEVTVVRTRGASSDASTQAVFDESGGTIGRADTNALVLDDPDRTVSRVHAQIVARDGQFFIIDRGSNPLIHNNQNVGAGNERPLADGDHLTIGSFELAVKLLSASTAAHQAVAMSDPDMAGDDPFADLLAGLAPPVQHAPEPAMPKPEVRSPAMDIPDPFGIPPAGGQNPHAGDAADPFADLLGDLGGGGARAPTDASGAGSGVVQNFSGLAPPSGRGQTIDALFSLGGGIGGDPLSLGPLGDPLSQPNTAHTNDPMVSLQQGALPTPEARSDHLPIAHFGYQPPRERVPSPAPVQAAKAEPDRPAQPIGQAAERVGIHNDSGAAPTPVHAPMVAAPPVAPVQPAANPPPTAEPTRTTPDDELLAAFIRGLGALHQSPTTLTPGLMERLGHLLRSATEGTLQLLLTRQEFKREVRAQVTMIAAQANNPLKFSPTVDVALAHLIGPGVRGFMPAEAAMRDAYQDLRAHEFGVMVGTRAALAHLIERFAPDALEKNITAKSRLDSIFASNRKAKLWDQYVTLYDAIAKEAEDDFHSLFGKAFLQAYDEQMARLKASEDRSSGE